MTADPVPDALPDLPSVGGMMATVSYVRIDEHGTGRVITRRIPVPIGGGAELERLRLADAAVCLVVALGSILETTGWKPDTKTHRRPSPLDGDPTSGEGSPL